MSRYVTGALLAMTILEAAPDQVSFPTADSGIVYADVYGAGDCGVVLAHGARFDKASWKPQAIKLAQAGHRVIAIDFRGYGKSHGGTQARNTHDEMYLDVLAAVAYLRSHGASTVGVVGGSMGGGAAANAVVKGQPGQIDRLVLIAHATVEAPERITGPKLFIVSEGDPIASRVREQYDQAPEPKKLVLLSGSAHAQFLFTTDEGSQLMSEILQFLSTETGAVQ